MTIKAIVTMPPYADYMREVARHPIVSGVRLNTVMPTKGSLEDVLKRMQDNLQGKDLFVDLKGRQLRVEGYWVPPFTEIQVSHPLKVNTPVKAYFSDGMETATITEVDGKRLILQDAPRRVIGPGESLNIVDRSLHIDGYLTDTDKNYMEACEKIGLKDYMLSFVESSSDVSRFKELISDANLIAKIESSKGLSYVTNDWDHESRLMTARGDLYLEVGRPHLINKGAQRIVEKDPDAIVGSRIFTSLGFQAEPSCADIGDCENLLRMGYKTLMFGDELCMHRHSVVGALNLLQAVVESYGG